MGKYLNPGNEKFRRMIQSEIYVDKTGMIKYTNSVLDTAQNYVCVSRPRRFGKSMAANMLTAYYSRGCNSKELFGKFEIAKDKDFEKYLNQYNTIFLNMQEFLSRSHNAEELIDRVKKLVIRDLKMEYPEVDYFDDTDLIECMQDIYAETQYPFVVIIDEWDCIFREYKQDKEAQEKYLDFLRDLLKDKVCIYLSYMTGILPIKKYGTHSALNMFDEFSMIVGESVAVNTESFTNDMATFRTEDDVLTLLIHLGYLAYDDKTKTVKIPNSEIRAEYVNTVSVSDWGTVSKALKDSADTLDAIWQGREKQVKGIREV